MHKISENVRDTDVLMAIATLNNSANTPIWFSMKEYDNGRACALAGTIAAGGAVTVQLRQAKTSAGGSAKDVTGYSTSFADTDDDSIKGIDFRAENLDTNNGFTYVGLLLTETGTQNAVMCAWLERERCRHAQASLQA